MIDLEITRLSKVSQTERETPYDVTYMESKTGHKGTYSQSRDLETQKINLL